MNFLAKVDLNLFTNQRQGQKMLLSENLIQAESSSYG